jgi:hypothetical protein
MTNDRIVYRVPDAIREEKDKAGKPRVKVNFVYKEE